MEPRSLTKLLSPRAMGVTIWGNTEPRGFQQWIAERLTAHQLILQPISVAGRAQQLLPEL